MHLLCFYSVPGPRLNTGSRNESEIFSKPRELAMWTQKMAAVCCAGVSVPLVWKEEIVKGASVS